MNRIPPVSKSKIGSLRKLARKKFRTSETQFLIEGPHVVEEAVGSGWKVLEILCTDRFLEKGTSAPLLSRAAGQGIPLHRCAENELRMLSDTVTSQGIVGVAECRRIAADDVLGIAGKESLLVALESVSDPGNVGTILRTSDWFGVQGAILGSGTAELYNPKVIRSSMGAIFHIPVAEEADLGAVLRRAKRSGFAVIATSGEGGVPLSAGIWPERSLLVAGNEARGVSPGVRSEADMVVTIPGFGRAESLNVAIACGIIIATARLFSAGGVQHMQNSKSNIQT